MAEKHDDWLHKVLGVAVGAGKAIGHAAVQVEHGVAQVAQGVGHAVESGAKAVGHAVATGAEAVSHAVDSAVQHVVDPAGAAITDFAKAIKRLDTQVKTLAAAGLDAGHYVAQAKDIRIAYSQALSLKDPSEKTAALKKAAATAEDAADRAEKDIKRTKGAAVEGVSKAIIDMRDSAKALIDKLPAKDPGRPDLVKLLADVNAAIEADGKITDRAQRAKHEKVTQKLAEELLDKAGEASHDKEAVQKTYEKALEDRYGFKVNNKGGINTHNDQLYKMFDKVPDGDVTQDKMKSFTYSNKDENGNDNPSAYYTDAKIVARDYPDDATLTYAGKQENAFSITTLHELGHSVDDRFGIMKSHQSKPGAGGWNHETVDTVANAYATHFVAGAGKAIALDAKAVAALAKAALSGKAPKQPAGLSAKDWATVSAMLAKCAARTVGKNPWNSQDDVGGRCYHQSYSNQWNSYLTSARGTVKSVSDYQWRAPGEFFAELYAFTYFKSQPAPNGVDAGLAAYMFGGASSGKGKPA